MVTSRPATALHAPVLHVLATVQSMGGTMARRQAAVPLSRATLHGDELIATPIGPIALIHTYFDDDASERLFDELDYQRATQAYIWSTPLVSMATWRDRQCRAYGVTADTDFVVLESLKETRGLVTGDFTAPYLVNFSRLTSGALQIQYPVGRTVGGVLDFWQRSLCDFAIAGTSATYVIVGPEDEVSTYRRPGVHVVQSATNNILISLRSLDTEPFGFDTFTTSYRMGRVGDAVAPSRFIRGRNVDWSATAPRGLDYWQTLADILAEEPVREVDKAWLAMLRPLGIDPLNRFDPDRRQQALLCAGAAMGELMIRNLQVNPRDATPYWPGTYWFTSVDIDAADDIASRVALDERATLGYEAVAGTKARVTPCPGEVSLTSKRDSQGRMLRADKTYRLHVPVGPRWALTLYSENTRRAYDNGGAEIRSVHLESTMPGLHRNGDGSLDVFVGATEPSGARTFLKTVGTDGWFVYFRLYAPEEPFGDTTFALRDFERVD